MNEPLTQLAIQAAGNEASGLWAIDGGAPEEREAIAVFGGDTEHAPARRSVFVQPTPGRLPLPAVPARPGVPAVYLGIGALAGMAVSLVLFNVLAPVKIVRTTVVVHEIPAARAVSAIPRARQVTPAPMTASALPALIVTSDAKLPTVHILPPRDPGVRLADKPQGRQGVARLSSPPAPAAAIASGHEPQHVVVISTPRGRAPTFAAPAAAPAVFSASTVLYQAPSTPATPPPSGVAVMPSSSPSAAPTPAPASAAYTVISVPSRDIALVESTVQGRAMVSPYKVGQSLPDGKVILAMDPGAGVLRTSGGNLRSQPEQ